MEVEKTHRNWKEKTICTNYFLRQLKKKSERVIPCEQDILSAGYYFMRPYS